MEWNIRNDYDPGDETLHFGTRAYAESDGCIYEISTAATFQNENDVPDTPSSLTFGYISNGGVCVCVGNTLTVFANESSSSSLFNSAFDGDIETFTCSPDGNFLLVGLNNGYVHCLHIPSEGEAVYIKKLQTQPRGGRMFVKFIIHESCPQDVLVVCASGIVVNFENFDFKLMHSVHLSGNPSEMKELRSNISIATLCGISSIAPIRSASSLILRDQITILAVGEGIATLSTGVSSTPTGDSGEVKWTDHPSTTTLIKLQATSDKRLFVALDATGQLLCVCPFTLMTVKLPQKNYKSLLDFQLIGDSTSEAVIVAVTPSSDENCNLCMLSFSGLQEKFSLSVGQRCFLMETMCNVEDIPFLELGIVKASQAATVSLKAATQTNPNFRLERLLTRKKFDAAESLAKNFGLDMSSVHMARAQCFLDQMQPWKTNSPYSSEENKSIMGTLLSELDKIKDLDFITNCCVNAVPPDYFVAHSLLDYAQNRLEQFFVNNPELESKVSKLSASVCGSILRLETFNLLKCTWDVDEWLKFSRADLLRDVQTWIRQGELSKASIIWSRHKSSFKDCLADEYIVIYLLEEIPAWVPLDKILEWLVHLLPSLLEVQPASLPKVVMWMLSKISGLEDSHPREWPKIGLDYAERMLNLMASQKIASPFLGVEASPLRPLVVLRCCLADLHCLRSKYYIFLTLEDLSQPPEDVAITLLDNIDVGLISTFITQYLKSFVLNHKLDIDLIVSTYVKLVLQCSNGEWYWEEAPWELRIATLLPHITNYKIRLECINAALEAAPCPWSSVISAVAEEGLKLKHPLSSLIREKQKQISTNLVLKKYGFNIHINKIDRQVLLRNIVKQNHADMFSDIAELSQKSVDDYVIVIQELFFLGNASKALEVLRKLPDTMIVEVCPQIIHTVSLTLDLPDVSPIEEDLDFISAVAICHETTRASNPPGISKIEDLDDPRNLPLSIKEIKNRFCLKRDFRKYLTVKEMADVQCRENALKDIVQDLLIEVVENEKPQERTTRIYRKSSYAAQLLLLSPALSLTEIIEQAINLSDFELATFIVGVNNDLKNLSSFTIQRLSRLPALFLKKLQSLDRKDRNVELIQKASSEVYNLVSKVCSHCDLDLLRGVSKVLGWSRVWDFVSGQQEISLLGQRDPLQHWRFTPLYKDPGLAGFMSGCNLNEFLCNAFSFIINPEVSGENFVSEVTQSISKLRNDQHDLAVVLILSQLFWAIQTSSKQEVCPAVEESLYKSCEVLLSKVSGARHFDKHLGLSLLASMGRTAALKYLLHVSKSAHMDFQRQKALSFLGTIVSNLWNMPELHSQFKLMSLQSTWGLRLSELGIPAKELLRAKVDTEVVVQKLIESKNATPHLLSALCSDYQLDLQAALLQHLCSVLLSWDPEPIVTVNPDGTKDVILRNTHQQLLDQCWEIQKHIKNKSLLCTTVVSSWPKVNFYHHEVFIVILDILERHGVDEQTEKRLATTFLKNYRRIKPPNEEEEEFWSEVFPSSFGLPPMSEFRLPYSRKLTDTPLKVVRHELNLNTYKKWLTVAAALNIPKDKLCISAVHQSVTEEFSGHQNSLEWCGTLKNEAIFESIAACVADMDNIEQAAATLYFFMGKIPAGLDQVAVANLCLQYAQSVYDQTGETEYKIKLEKKYIHLATLQTLHMYGLGQPSYLQLVRNPTELITALYQHPTILELCRGTASYSLDINTVVEEICRLHSICLKTLHINLVTEWLQPDVLMDCNSSMDEDCYRSINRNKKKDYDNSDLYGTDENILRARYIMEHGDVQEWAYFLIGIVYQGEACTGMRLRAMQCLCMLTDDETLEYLAGRTMSDIRKKLHSLAYLKDLEILGLRYSESGFDSCDKKELANLILRTQTQSPRAISLVVHLCIDFNITNMSLWNAVFQQLVDLSMMKELEQALSHTSEMYQLWTVPSYSKAWNLLLTSPFRNASSNPDEEQKSAMLRSITLLPSCPVLKHVDVVGALDHCLTNQMPDMAALLLPFVDYSLMLERQEKILSIKKQEHLIDDLKKISHEKCINISKIINLLSPQTVEAPLNKM
ncbi:kinetochore-associated protein 1 [Thrips palmi]|uniref:Kinetochore-associated protein 1 n=1 Tax=Thrips palmi TaxID=161013 RepID=A0A6P8ZYZ7_THRPL|nr:kinetochore-associated protein 1 [Thrips palmi]